MSSVIFSRSYCGFQPHSLRAQLSSILSISTLFKKFNDYVTNVSEAIDSSRKHTD